MILAEVWKRLYENRVLRLDREIDAAAACEISSGLLSLDDDSSKPITLYINSPGGEVSAGLQIVDTMYALRSMVFTVNTGICASMAAVILSAGAKRMTLPHARVMIHQVSSGMQGNIQDIETNFRETMKMNQVVLAMLAENCGRTLEQIREDTSRDYWMYPQEAIQYGIVDEIIGQERRRIWQEKDS